jgi:hypothetical protein
MSKSPVHVQPRRRALALSIGLACAAASTQATAHTWPNLTGVGSCQSTLQACIDVAAPGDTIVVGNDDLLIPDGHTAINESIIINKSLTLAGAAGVDAVFTPGHTINVGSPLSGAMNLTLDHLVLHDTHMVVDHLSDTASTYTLSRFRVEDTDSGACAIYFSSNGSGTPTFNFGDGDLHFHRRSATSSTADAVCATGTNGGTWYVNFFRNRVRIDHGAIYGGMSITSVNAGYVSFMSNQIVGNDFKYGIRTLITPGSPANSLDVLSNVVDGQGSDGESAIALHMTNTTLRAINNTSVNNQRGLLVARFGADSTSGRVANNLVAFNRADGLYIASDVAVTVSNGYNLVYGNASDLFTPGGGTIVGDPGIASVWNPRPTALSSLAVGTGNLADVPVFPFVGPGFDADGEPRVIASVDIGAYELQRDRSGLHRSTAANIGSDYTDIDEPGWLFAADAALLTTPLNDPTASSEMANTLGVFESSLSPSNWSIYHENQQPLSAGRAFSVFAPLDGRPWLVHTTSSGSVVNQYTRLDAAELDGNPEAIAFVMHNWNPGGPGGVYHDHRIGLEYVGSHWFIRNEDSAADMPSGVSFNVVVAPQYALNAFRAYVGGSPVSELKLEHPLLDGNPCAAVQITRADSPFDTSFVANDVPFALAYRSDFADGPGHWYLYSVGPGGTTFPANAGFNVMMQGAQANACRDDRIFVDGFDS